MWLKFFFLLDMNGLFMVSYYSYWIPSVTWNRFLLQSFILKNARCAKMLMYRTTYTSGQVALILRGCFFSFSSQSGLCWSLELESEFTRFLKGLAHSWSLEGVYKTRFSVSGFDLQLFVCRSCCPLSTIYPSLPPSLAGCRTVQHCVFLNCQVCNQ